VHAPSTRAVDLKSTQKARELKQIGDTVIIFGIAVGIAVLVMGSVLSIPILGTAGGVLLTVGLIVWILRQAQSVVLASLLNRPSPPRRSKLSPTVPNEAVADGADRGHRADLSEAFAIPNGRKLTSGIGVTSQFLKHFST